jgi:5-carboxymethyl-2-hydroxymuconate isomerase
MAQIKIYGIKEKLIPVRERLSEVIHECVMDALQFPADKRAHRFFLMDKEDMLYPAGRTDAYTIIEITMIEGRTIEAKKKLIRLLFDNIRDKVDIQLKISKFAFKKARHVIGVFAVCMVTKLN